VLLVILSLVWAMGNQAAATREVARAATVSAVGQTVNSVAVTLLALLLVGLLLLLLVGALYLYVRYQRWQRQRSAGRRLPRSQGHYTQSPVSSADRMLERMVQLQSLRLMQDLQPPPRRRTPVLPTYYEEPEDQEWFG
jgi:hypothetical protein